MAKVTSKLQVTVPKAVADHYRIRPGDEIQWLIAGDAIRIIPPGRKPPPRDPLERLRRFDQATARQAKRNDATPSRAVQGRGWTREELYERDRAR
jgi:AbrB family looped-hinge helix DNA binding protein